METVMSKKADLRNL